MARRVAFVCLACLLVPLYAFLDILFHSDPLKVQLGCLGLGVDVSLLSLPEMILEFVLLLFDPALLLKLCKQFSGFLMALRRRFLKPSDTFILILLHTCPGIVGKRQLVLRMDVVFFRRFAEISHRLFGITVITVSCLTIHAHLIITGGGARVPDPRPETFFRFLDLLVHSEKLLFCFFIPFLCHLGKDPDAFIRILHSRLPVDIGLRQRKLPFVFTRCSRLLCPTHTESQILLHQLSFFIEPHQPKHRRNIFCLCRLPEPAEPLLLILLYLIACIKHLCRFEHGGSVPCLGFRKNLVKRFFSLRSFLHISLCL